MRLSTLSLAVTLAAGAAMADSVAPSDVVYTDGSVEQSVSGAAGDAAAGAKVMANRGQGNCVACHEVSALDAAFQGNVGPSLDGAADRWDEAQLRGIISNPKMMFEGTVMPAFYKTEGYNRPGDGYTGNAAEGPIEPILTAQQVEDVVAFLLTLKE